jgi:glycosyltransferase involved in cell wall biosynthesis
MLAILTTHPIQYQVPIWRALASAGNPPFTVCYLSDQGLHSRFDPGFGRAVAWDIDLVSGYPHEFLPARVGPRQNRFDWLGLAPGFGKFLRDRGISVLWVQGWQVKAYWQAVREARRAGVEIWIRGDTNLRSNAGGGMRWARRLLLKRLLNQVDRFLTVGVANQAFFEHLGYARSVMSPAPHCVENDRFVAASASQRPMRSALRAAWGIPDDAFCLLSVGKFVAKKRPLDIVAAAASLIRRRPDIKLHVLWVGSGELGDAVRESCRIVFDAGQTCAERGSNDDRPAASFAGFLNQGEITQAYVAADALVLTSDAKETWGLVVNEAMASGLPCVVSNAVGCADDLVLPFRPDLCFPLGDIDALACSIEAVIANPPSAEQLQTHIAAYSPQRTVETVRALYHQAVAAA